MESAVSYFDKQNYTHNQADKKNKSNIFFILLISSMFFTSPLIKGFVTIRLFDILVGTYLFYLLYVVLKHEKIIVPRHYFFFIYMLFSLIVFYSFLWGGSINVTIKDTAQLVEIGMIYIFLINLYQDVSIQLFVKTIFYATVVVSLFYFFKMAYANQFIGFKHCNEKIIPGLCASLSFYFLLNEHDFKDKIILCTIFIFTSLLTFIAFEKKAWLALIFSVSTTYTLFFYIRYKRGFWCFIYRFLKMFSIISLIIIITIYISIHALSEQRWAKLEKRLASTNQLINYVLYSNDRNNTTKSITTNTSHMSDSKRIMMLKMGYYQFINHPMLGLGAEQSKKNFALRTNGKITHSIHSVYLQKLLNYGLLGFTLLLLLHLAFLRLFFLLVNYDYALFAYVIWSYGIVINMLRPSNMINYIFIVLPMFILLFSVSKKSNFTGLPSSTKDVASI